MEAQLSSRMAEYTTSASSEGRATSDVVHASRAGGGLSEMPHGVQLPLRNKGMSRRSMTAAVVVCVVVGVAIYTMKQSKATPQSSVSTKETPPAVTDKIDDDPLFHRFHRSMAQKKNTYE